MVVKALIAVTILRLNHTYGIIKETRTQLEKINISIERVSEIKKVFEISPSADPAFLKHRKEYFKKNKNVPGKTILVFLAANQDLYGSLISNIAKLFIADFKEIEADALVIGKVGRQILEKADIRSEKIRYFDIDDDRPDMKVISQILTILEGYDKIFVYHGRTESFLMQVAAKSEIAGKMNIQVFKPTKKYIFEPNATEVMDFLQVQTSVNSFHQRIYEAQYAKLAAKRWNWTKQQMARSRLLEELTKDFLRYKKSLLQRQQQVAVFAHRQNIIDNPSIVNTNIYGK